METISSAGETSRGTGARLGTSESLLGASREEVSSVARPRLLGAPVSQEDVSTKGVPSFFSMKALGGSNLTGSLQESPPAITLEFKFVEAEFCLFGTTAMRFLSVLSVSDNAAAGVSPAPSSPLSSTCGMFDCATRVSTSLRVDEASGTGGGRDTCVT